LDRARVDARRDQKTKPRALALASQGAQGGTPCGHIEAFWHVCGQQLFVESRGSHGGTSSSHRHIPWQANSKEVVITAHTKCEWQESPVDAMTPLLQSSSDRQRARQMERVSIPFAFPREKQIEVGQSTAGDRMAMP
jgi:hypothetical protein